MRTIVISIISIISIIIIIIIVTENNKSAIVSCFVVIRGRSRSRRRVLWV